jgi:hypothetical protein
MAVPNLCSSKAVDAHIDVDVDDAHAPKEAPLEELIKRRM